MTPPAMSKPLHTIPLTRYLHEALAGRWSVAFLFAHHVNGVLVWSAIGSDDFCTDALRSRPVTRVANEIEAFAQLKTSLSAHQQAVAQ
jgi:hypothetical protein